MIGPGHLIMVVGPSGAGKDTLISGARSALSGNDRIVFPRRVVTRQGGEAEDHDTLSPPDFDRAAAQGAFCLSWDAHGLKYGIPVSVDTDLAAGRIAVCNTSRGVIAEARARYANVCVVLITAPVHVLEARLASRARASDGSVKQRVERSASVPPFEPEATIENDRTAEIGTRRLVEVIEACLD
jgi:ribose 1,5-bisphosphokinase